MYVFRQTMERSMIAPASTTTWDRSTVGPTIWVPPAIITPLPR